MAFLDDRAPDASTFPPHAVKEFISTSPEGMRSVCKHYDVDFIDLLKTLGHAPV